MKKRSIILVDDDAQYLGLLCSILADNGFEICKATSAEEALAILSTRRFSTMVTDLQMPGMDGVELSAVAGRLDPLMEIVLVTGAVTAEVLGRAAFTGIRTVLGKPVQMQDLLHVLRATAAAPDPAGGACGAHPAASNRARPI
ncbi:response regulator [Geomonas ferrireducens]|uniref:response regulator n=1 Tax=Geomonas ferrireducens TaxID=2570227 RepID=UPI0010A81397|nr:response regulator [Geomonas ferrireducens]